MAPRRIAGLCIVKALTRSRGTLPLPLLLCLNLQRCYMDPTSPLHVPRAAHIAINAQSCLSWARRMNLPIVHVHNAMDGRRSKPISGCRPLASEPLLSKNSLSFFEAEEFQRLVFTEARLNAIVLGFTGIADCLRLAISGERRGARLVFVADAIGSPQIGAHDPVLLDEVVTTMLEQFGSSVKTSEILTLEAGWENIDVG